jgi:TusA-related sulfurtransferase
MSGYGVESEAANSMRADRQLDISDVVSPISLALCKAILGQMVAGAVLEICLRDQETMRDLMMIVERSEDRVLAWEKRDELFHLWVERGIPTKP